VSSTIWYEDNEAFFEGDNCSLAGVATYDVTLSKAYDADIGGTDGIEVDSVELFELRLDGLKLSREQVIDAAGRGSVEGSEESVMDYLRHNPDTI